MAVLLDTCLSPQGHHFVVSVVAAGQVGHTFIYCQRCGATRAELIIAASRNRTAI